MIKQEWIKPRYQSMWGEQRGTKLTNTLCSDGKFRTFTATAEADTFFTLPGRVKANGKTISGFLWHDSMDESAGEDGTYKFSAYSYRKNALFLPEWSS